MRNRISPEYTRINSQTASLGMRIGLAAFGLILALFLGALSALFGGIMTGMIFIPLIFAVLVVFNYRVGIFLLALMLPFASTELMPRSMLGLTGANPINLLFMATIFSMFIHSLINRQKILIWPPKMLWLFVGLIIVYGLMGSFHAGEIPVQYKILKLIKFDGRMGYLRDIMVKPMFFILFAMLVAMAIKEKSKFTLIFVPVILSALLLSSLLIAVVALSGLSLSNLSGSTSRGVLSKLGMHANDFGIMLNMVYALILFGMSGLKSGILKVFAFITLGIIAIAIVLTFSRGGYLGFAALHVYYMFVRGLIKPRTLITMFIAGLVLMLLPQEVFERFTTGFSTGDREAITAGRLDHIWLPLVPWFFDNPIIGHGLTSIIWSPQSLSGATLLVTHPHSAYVAALIDFGLAGTIVLVIFYVWLWRQASLIIKHDPNPQYQMFINGVRGCMVLLFIQGLSTGSFIPTPQQVFLWLGIGVLIGRLAVLPPAAQTKRQATGFIA